MSEKEVNIKDDFDSNTDNEEREELIKTINLQIKNIKILKIF